jgi:predicted secreted protein
MAYEMKIRGTEDEVKVRSPWAVALLPFVTFGVYHVVWWYKINKELKAFGEAKGYDLGQNPTNSALALFPGFLIIVPPLVSYWRGTKRVQGASKIAGREPASGWITLILYLLLWPAMFAYLQVSLNNVWEQEAEPLPGHDAPPAPSESMPPRI